MGSLMFLPHPSSGTGWGETMPAVDVDAGLRASAAARSRRSLVAGGRGVLALLFGVLALLWPDVTVPRLALLFGAYTLLSGIVLISTLTDETADEPLRWGSLLAGFAGLLVGLMTLLWPHITGLILVLLAGTWAVLTGLLELTATTTALLEAPLTGRRRGARTAVGLLAVVGIASMATGLVVLMSPDAGAAALGTVLGVYALIAGAVLLAAGWQWRDVVPSGR
ncbi:MAG TPA: DUF308 domain-containing protein [Jatrophihabitans sp.]|nr:DUF308 domain-containing protein [Jatrophihabitans sp.]